MGKQTKKQAPPTVIRCRIAVLQPPAGVQFRLQEGPDDLVAPVRVTGGEIQFEFSLRLGTPRQGQPNFLGPAAQGPAGGRFVYINSGRRAGQTGTPWDRRAKVPLSGITKALVQSVLVDDRRMLEARIAGTANDGGPVCATVPLLGGAWRVVTGAAA
jgi:hypothetical protein